MSRTIDAMAHARTPGSLRWLAEQVARGRELRDLSPFLRSLGDDLELARETERALQDALSDQSAKRCAHVDRLERQLAEKTQQALDHYSRSESFFATAMRLGKELGILKTEAEQLRTEGTASPEIEAVPAPIVVRCDWAHRLEYARHFMGGGFLHPNGAIVTSVELRLVCGSERLNDAGFIADAMVEITVHFGESAVTVRDDAGATRRSGAPAE